MEGRSVAVFAAAAAIGASLYVFFAPSVEKKKRVKKDCPPGLVNLGNSCFMNSILQGIAFLPSVVTWLQALTAEKNGEHVACVALELKKLVKALNSGCVEGEDDVLCPESVLKALHSHGWVISSEQQDAHEFFQVLSSTLDDEMGELPGVLDLGDIATVEKDDPLEDKSMVHRNKVPLTRSCSKMHLPFHGLLASQLVCKQCGTKCPVKFDGYDSLSLSLPTTFQVGLGLEDLLRKFVCSETVDAVECQGCRRAHADQPTVVRTKFIKRLTLGKLPQCLCIHIQRTYWHSNGIPYKNNSFIKFPEFLDLEPFLYEPLEQHNTSTNMENGLKTSHSLLTANGGLRVTREKPVKKFLDDLVCSLSLREGSSRAVYRLMAAIVHLGDVDDGHYVTFRRYEPSPGNGHASRWLYTSDEHVEPASRDQVLKCCAYMLFYERTGR